MDKAKALYGKFAGELIEANSSNLDYEICKTWKLICPDCHQPIHLRKSDNKINYFAHYDFEDKNCQYRISFQTNKRSDKKTENHDQSLIETESFIEKLFYGIPSANIYEGTQCLRADFNNVSTQEHIGWIRESIDSFTSKIIHSYLEKNTFMNWRLEKAKSYILDFCHILCAREKILSFLVGYSICLKEAAALQINQLKAIYEAEIYLNCTSSLINLVIIDLIIKRLLSILESNDELKFATNKYCWIECKITENHTSKINFKDILYVTLCEDLPILVRRATSSRKARYIVFSSEGKVNSFSYNETGRFRGTHENLNLYVNKEDTLYIEGFLDNRFSEKQVTHDIQKVLFNRSGYSMLLLLQKGYISKEIAEKAAQLALFKQYKRLSPCKALEEFRYLSKKA